MEEGFTFGERVKVILKFLRVTQSAFAKKTGMDLSQLNKLLNGKRNPTSKELVKIVDALGIPYECLIGKSSIFDSMLETIEEVIASCIW